MKKIQKIIFVVILIVLLFPIDVVLKKGGTNSYNAILFGITKRHSFVANEGYNIGTEIRILWFEVYNDVEFVPLETGK